MLLEIKRGGKENDTVAFEVWEHHTGSFCFLRAKPPILLCARKAAHSLLGISESHPRVIVPGHFSLCNGYPQLTVVTANQWEQLKMTERA